VVIVGLLVVALVSLIVGLVLPNSAWLLASLIGTAGAGYLLWRTRRNAAAVATPEYDGVVEDGSTEEPADVPAAELPPAEPDADDADGTSEVDSAEASDVSASVDDAHTEQFEAVAAGPNDVWVIDGRPRYHLQDCAIIKGQNAEPIPYQQATEDGFMPCSLCDPDTALAAGA
jgi:hypothetical protein